MSRANWKLLSLIGLICLFAIGCGTQKKGCGCGNNLNYYKPKKFNK